MRCPMDAAARLWWERELAGCAFADARFGLRLRKLIERMDGAIGASLPLVCQDWANTKAAYRFFSNDRVSEAQIVRGDGVRHETDMGLGRWTRRGPPTAPGLTRPRRRSCGGEGSRSSG